MQAVSRESSVEALGTLPLALDRLSPEIDSGVREEFLANVITRDRALLQRLPRPNVEQNLIDTNCAELRAHLAARLRALPEADWTHHFLIGEEWYSIEELLARHIAEDCIALRQLLEIAAPIKAESDAPKVLHVRQLTGTNTLSKQRVQTAMPHHLRASNVVVPARRHSRLRRIIYFFFEAFIEDNQKFDLRTMLGATLLIYGGAAIWIPWINDFHQKDFDVMIWRFTIWLFLWTSAIVTLGNLYQKRKK